jgi:hypothetical protein
VSEAIEADLAFLQSLQRTDSEQRAAFHLAFGPIDLDFDGYVGLRLGEHALHAWDVAVVLDPSAPLRPSSVDILIDALGRVAGFSGKPTGNDQTVHVSTSAPARGFHLGNWDRLPGAHPLRTRGRTGSRAPVRGLHPAGLRATRSRPHLGSQR